MPPADLSVFLPWSVYGLLEEAAAGRLPRRTCEGTVLFCDVAGFTPLTEALSVLGREGSEELTRLLNAYFTRMIGILSEEGGDVLRFGGDAMTVFFPGDSRGRAARGALRMMEAMEEFAALPTRAGTFSLSMKIGAACGPVHLGLVGSAGTGWDYYAAGAPLDASADAEHHSVPGRVVLHPTFARGAPGSLTLEPLEGGYARLVRAPDSGGLSLLPPEPPREEVLRAHIPRYLAERAGAGVIGEHRGTAVVFFAFSGLSWEDPGATHLQLDALFGRLAATARRYGGSLNKVDFGDKGAKAILLFGAPFACEMKEEMAARAALELLAPPGPAPGVTARAGITAAPLFSGPVGSPARREFTVMGDGINLAARLMAAAEPGRAFAAKEVAAAAAALRFTALPAITVKGKREPVALFVPEGEASEARGGELGPLVEREAAMAALRGALFGSAGRVPLVAAEAGLGKTALAQWALREARAREIPAVLVPLAPFSADRAFGALKAPVRILVGACKGDGPQRLRELREASLAPEEPTFRPLLNPFLDLPEESSPALRALSPKERKELTFAVVRRLLDAGGERVVLVDGLQWADPLSLDLLSFLASDAAGAPWRLALFTRPAELSPALREGCHPVELPALTPAGLRAVLEEAHGLGGLSGTGLGWFAAKARGNPALAAALVRTLREEGLLREAGAAGLRLDEDRLAATAFPDTLEGLYLKRVDALAPLERQVIQEASALGHSVSLNLLGRVSAVPRAPRDQALAALAAKGLLREDSRGPRPYMTFSESLLREAVYGALPFGLRRPVHLRALDALLEMEGEENPRLWPTLAHHAEEGGDARRARRFHRMAGREALERFDNLSALRHLEFVCATPTADEEDAQDAFRLLDVYGVLGRRENAAKLLEALRPLASALAEAHRARLLFFEARERWQRQEWAKAERHLLEGLELYRACGDTSGVGKSYVNLVGGVYGPTGQLEKAREALEKALALPRGPDQRTWRTTAAMNLGALLYATGRQAEALDSLRRAHSQASRAGLGPQRGVIADNLCALLGEMGRFEEAVRWGRRAVGVLDAFAVRGPAMNARYNLALAHLAGGRTQEVRGLLEQVVAQSSPMGNLHAVATGMEGLAQAAALDGDLGDALLRARRALEVFRSLEDSRGFRFTLAIVGNLHRSLAAPDRWNRFLEECGAAGFLEGHPDATADVPLLRLGAWGSGRDTHAAATPGGEPAPSSPEEALDRRLWVAEADAERGDITALAGRLEGLTGALAAWPYFDARLRVLRLQLLADGASGASRRAECLRLLSRSLGGVWGLRLLCLLWQREPPGAKARALRQRALCALYFVHAHSPPWARERVSAFPEVRAALRGFRP